MNSKKLTKFEHALADIKRDVAPPRDNSGCHYGICTVNDCGRCRRAKAFYEAEAMVPQIREIHTSALNLLTALGRYTARVEKEYKELTDGNFGKFSAYGEAKGLQRALTNFKNTLK